ncbi:MAG: CGNR zinc finger domain-containing protein [Actinomycetota bacterium]
MDHQTSEAAQLIADFVNTSDFELGTDEIDSPAHLRAWITARMGIKRAAVDGDAWKTTIAARESLRALLASHARPPPPRRVIADLNRAGRAAHVGVQWSPSGAARFEPGDAGPYGALGRILAAVVTSQAEGTWPRLKVCPAEDCRAVFYDHSKNRSGKWCTMRVCGNRSKTRSYRDRRRQDA